MRLALLFGCLLLVVGSHASNPAMRHLLAINTAGWPTTGNCSATDPTTPCDMIVNVYTGSSTNAAASAKFQAKLIDVAGKIITGDLTYANINSDLCIAHRAYKICVDATLTACGNSAKAKVTAKRKSVLLLSKYLENEVCKKTTIGDKLKSFDVKKCYSGKSLTASKVKGKVIKSLEKLVKKGKCKDAMKEVRKITKFYSSSKDCKGKVGPMANFLALLFVEADQTCDMSKFKDNPSDKDRGDPRSKQRRGAQFCSLNHYRLAILKIKTDAVNYITCADESSPQNRTLFDWDFLSLECEMYPANENGVSNTQCRRACLTILDDEYEEAGKFCLSADQSFEKEGRTIKAGKKKSGGKLKHDVKATARNKNLLIVVEKNSGTFIAVRRSSYKNPAGKTVYLLIINIRTSKSVMDASSGLLVKACEAVKDLAAILSGKRRRKRSTGSNVQSYDKKGTGDPNAGNFLTDANSDGESAESEDAVFSAAGRVSSSVALFSLTMLAAVWAM